MKLSALIQGKKTANSLCPATANFANVAKDEAKQGAIVPRLAGLATLALAIPGAEMVNVTLPTVATEEELMQMIRNAYAELDTLRDWTGWRASLATEELQRITEIETRVDTTYAAFDRDGLRMALRDYRTAAMGSG